MLLEGISQVLLRRKRKKDNFSNQNTDNEDNNNMANILLILNLIIFFISLYLFFECKKLKGEFKLLEFLGAICYPIIYVIYRLIVPPNEQNCKSQAKKLLKNLQI